MREERREMERAETKEAREIEVRKEKSAKRENEGKKAGRK